PRVREHRGHPGGRLVGTVVVVVVAVVGVVRVVDVVVHVVDVIVHVVDVIVHVVDVVVVHVVVVDRVVVVLGGDAEAADAELAARALVVVRAAPVDRGRHAHLL